MVKGKKNVSSRLALPHLPVLTDVLNCSAVSYDFDGVGHAQNEMKCNAVFVDVPMIYTFFERPQSRRVEALSIG